MKYVVTFSLRRNGYVVYRRMWISSVNRVAVPAWEIMFEGAKFATPEYALKAAERGQMSLGDMLFQAM